MSQDRAASYARVSSNDQHSVMAQLESIRRAADEQGLSLPREFEDEGNCGATDDRLGFQQMIAAALSPEGGMMSYDRRRFTDDHPPVCNLLQGLKLRLARRFSLLLIYALLIPMLLSTLLACASDEGEPTETLGEVTRTRESSGQPTPETDREVLEALYHATSGDNWSSNANWLSDAPLSTWYGVETDANGRVTVLSMSGNALSGQIPPSLGSLDKLRGLYLDANKLEGKIPADLDRLVSLELFFAALNQLSGEIPPELGGLDELRILDLSVNQLSGEIPPELGGLGSLQVLSLHGNQLEGNIPPALGKLSELQGLSLGDNRLSGEVPSELTNLGYLQWLNIAGNQLDGCVPLSLWYRLEPQLSDFGDVPLCR